MKARKRFSHHELEAYFSEEEGGITQRKGVHIDFYLMSKPVTPCSFECWLLMAQRFWCDCGRKASLEFASWQGRIQIHWSVLRVKNTWRKVLHYGCFGLPDTWLCSMTHWRGKHCFYVPDWLSKEPTKWRTFN